LFGLRTGRKPKEYHVKLEMQILATYQRISGPGTLMCICTSFPKQSLKGIQSRICLPN